MKVLHVLSSNSFSGAENVVCQIIELFANDSSFEMIYCSPKGPIVNALANRGIRYVSLESFTTKEIRRVISLENPDTIHAHDMRASYMVSLVCGKRSLICHVHNNNIENHGITLKSLAFLLPAWKASHIYYVSNSSYNGYCFHKLFNRKSSVLYNVINIDSLNKKMNNADNCNDYDVIFLGRLTHLKNPLRLLSVYRKAVDMKDDLLMAVVGTGILEDSFKKEIKRLHLENNIDILGYQSNPLRILHNSKVMLMTSLSEGTPMCALEALALGVPIVSTPVGGLCEIVNHDVNGYLSDCDEELSSYVANICIDDDLHCRLSMNAITWSKEFNDIYNYKKMLLSHY